MPALTPTVVDHPLNPASSSRISWNPVATSGIVIGVFPTTRPSKMTCAPDGRDTTSNEAGPVGEDADGSATVACSRGETRPTAVEAGPPSVGRCGAGVAAAEGGFRGAPAGPAGAGTIGSGFRFTGSCTDDSLNGCPPVAPVVGAGLSVAVAATVEPFPARYPLAKPIPMPITSAAAAANQMLTPLRRRGSSIDEADSVGSWRDGSAGSTTPKAGSGNVGRTAVSRNGKSTSGSSGEESDPCSGGPFSEALRS
jgi:hypothetical protein